jgi:AraC-like DNA-binding protein
MPKSKAGKLSSATPTNASDRKFYAGNRAFGRFGMRIFEPVLMDKPHWHGHVEGNHSPNSTLVYSIDGGTVSVPPGRFVVFWAGIPHRLIRIETDRGEKADLCNIYLPLDSFLFMPHIPRLQVALLSGAMIAIADELCPRNTLERWYRDYRSNSVERAEVAKMEINALFRRLCADPFDFVRKPWDVETAAADLASAHVRHVVAMIRYVLENLAEPMTNRDVANVTGLHVNYALALFSRTMRLSLKKFIIRMRLLRARAMLMESNIAITSVATQTGFNSMTQFYHHFSNAYGATPNQVRQNYVASAFH